MKMVDIGDKEITERVAIVEGVVHAKPEVIKLIREKRIPKGDCIEAARLAGILAAKKTPEIIPLCHPIPIEFVDIEFSLTAKEIRIRTTVKGRARTGVEMEAFTATSIACLTIYDMCKPIDRSMVISEIRLLKKSGGKSGTWER